MSVRVGLLAAAALLVAILVAELVLLARVRSEAAVRPHSFALVIGDCIWKPPSPAAAVGAVMYFFGVGATTGGEPFVHDFHAALADQYVAAGRTEESAAQEVASFDRCVASYVGEPQ